MLYWRLGEATGTTAGDSSPLGDQAGIYQNGVTLGAAGAIKGTTNTAASFDGVNDLVASVNRFSNPRNYSEEAWFKTTSTNGGKIIGFGDQQNGTSNNYDRHIYMTNDGKVTFGVWPGMLVTITSPTALNNGGWHHVVATQNSTDGMKLYIDGALVGTNSQTGAQVFDGYWRVGGDTQWGCCSAFLNGSIDDVAVYQSVLTATQVANHFNAGNGTAPVNQPPVAAFTATTTQLTATVDAGASSDPDGTIAAYAWNFGDGFTTTGKTASHGYATAGSKTITLTVTDNLGKTATVSKVVDVTAPPVNQPPVADFTSTVQNLTVALESTSSDPDGTISTQSWNFGDNTAATTAVTASHTYAAAGTYSVTLTVVDNGGASRSTTKTVTVTAPPAANVAPTASFSSTATGLQVTVNGSGSSDPEGPIASYAWNFGDGSTDSATTASTSHNYTAAGTYQVTLTVTDSGGATNALTKPVTVTGPTAAPLVSDTFSRVSTAGWGSADIGGVWTMTGGSSNFTVDGGTGKVRLATAGSGPTATLGGVTVADASASVSFAVDKAPTGSGVYLSLGARKAGTSEYRATARLLAGGTVVAQLSKTVAGTSTSLRSVTVSGLTYAAGDTLMMKFDVTGSSSVSLAAKIWKAGTTEPAVAQATATDASSPLGAGVIALYPYLSGSSTTVPVVVTFDDLTVVAVKP